MRKRTQLGLAALAASLLMAAAVSTASARSLEVSNQNIRATWASLAFGEPSAGVEVRCSVTLEGSFHSRTIVKRIGELTGAVTRISIKEESCVGGRARPVKPPPWHLTYEGFRGALPEITAILALITRFQFGMSDATGFCNGDYGTAEDRITFVAGRNTVNGQITELVPQEGNNIVHLLRRNSGIFCPERGFMTGSGRVMLLGNTNLIFVRLI